MGTYVHFIIIATNYINCIHITNKHEIIVNDIDTFYAIIYKNYRNEHFSLDSIQLATNYIFLSDL